MTGVDPWDAVFAKVDLSKVSLSSDDAQAVIEELLAKAPLQQSSVAAAAIRESAAKARTDRELLATAIRIVGSLVKFVA